MSENRKWVPPRVTVAIVSFVLGGCAFWTAENLWRSLHFPFIQFATQSQTGKNMMGMEDDESNIPLGGSFGFNGGLTLGSGEVERREDDQNVYYEISIPGAQAKTLEVKAEQGQVFISGQVEKKTEGEGASAIFSSSFQRSFPAPEGTDSEKVQVLHDKDKIILKFPKIK